MNKILIVATTISNRDEGVMIAQNAVRKRLAACAQLSERIESFYWWKDNIENSVEYVLSLKTTEKRYKELEQFIKDNHSYETPEIVATFAERISKEYGEWLAGEVN